MGSKGCELQDVVILSGVRLPIGKFGGTVRSVPVIELGAAVIAESMKRAGLPLEQADEVIMGHCRQAGNGPNPARAAAVTAGMPPLVPGQTINKACPSALRAVILASQAIRLGDAEVVIAGGMDSMSTIPHILKGARFDGFRLKHITIEDDWLMMSGLSGMSAIQGAEYIAKKHGISRADQDEFALQSHQKAAAAWRSGSFADEIMTFTVPGHGKEPAAVLVRDENVRPDTSLERLAKLPPAAPDVETITAGNACAMGDSAAALVLTSRRKAQELGAKPLASLVSYSAIGVGDVRDMFEGPPLAIAAALRRAGMSLGDMDLIEVNEAFAAQTVANERVAKWDRAKLNVHGGAVALGHPTGHTGARLVITLMNALRQRKKELGIAAICGGDAIGVSAVIRIEN